MSISFNQRPPDVLDYNPNDVFKINKDLLGNSFSSAADSKPENNFAGLTQEELGRSFGMIRNVVVSIEYSDSKGLDAGEPYLDLDQHSYDFAITFRDNKSALQFGNVLKSEPRLSVFHEYDKRMEKLLIKHNGNINEESFQKDLEGMNEKFALDMNKKYGLNITKISSDIAEGIPNEDPAPDSIQPSAKLDAPSLGG